MTIPSTRSNIVTDKIANWEIGQKRSIFAPK